MVKISCLLYRNITELRARGVTTWRGCLDDRKPQESMKERHRVFNEINNQNSTNNYVYKHR